MPLSVPTYVAFLVALCGSWMSSAVTSAVAEEVFRYSAQTDRQLIYESISMLTQTQKIGGAEIETEIETRDVSVRRYVSNGESPDLRMENENKILVIEMNVGPLGKYRFDSRETDRDRGSVLGNALTPLYEALTGVIIQVEHSDQGAIRKVTGFEGLIQDAVKDNPMAQRFAAGASPEGARVNYAESFVEFPKKALNPGDSWEVPVENDLPGIGRMTGKRIYRFEGDGKSGTRNTARFSIRTEMDIDVDLKENGAIVTGRLSVSESNGECHFDRGLGQLVEFRTKSTIAGDLNIQANGANTTMTQEQTQEGRYRLLEKLPEPSDE